MCWFYCTLTLIKEKVVIGLSMCGAVFSYFVGVLIGALLHFFFEKALRIIIRCVIGIGCCFCSPSRPVLRTWLSRINSPFGVVAGLGFMMGFWWKDAFLFFYIISCKLRPQVPEALFLLV